MKTGLFQHHSHRMTPWDMVDGKWTRKCKACGLVQPAQIGRLRRVCEVARKRMLASSVEAKRERLVAEGAASVATRGHAEPSLPR